VLCVEGVMVDCIAYVQLLIQSVPVDQLLGTKHVKLPPVLHVKLHPCFTRKLQPVLYVNSHSVPYVKLPNCVVRKLPCYT